MLQADPKYKKVINSKQFAQQIHTIHSSCESLYLMIQNFLDYSLIQSKKFKLFNKRYDVLEATKSVASLFDDSFNSKPLLCLVKNSTHKRILCDGMKMKYRQVLFNLISNCVKFTQKGGLIEIELQAVENNSCRVTISDTGIGMT